MAATLPAALADLAVAAARLAAAGAGPAPSAYIPPTLPPQLPITNIATAATATTAAAGDPVPSPPLPPSPLSPARSGLAAIAQGAAGTAAAAGEARRAFAKALAAQPQPLAALLAAAIIPARLPAAEIDFYSFAIAAPTTTPSHRFTRPQKPLAELYESLARRLRVEQDKHAVSAAAAVAAAAVVPANPRSPSPTGSPELRLLVLLLNTRAVVAAIAECSALYHTLLAEAFTREYNLKGAAHNVYLAKAAVRDWRRLHKEASSMSPGLTLSLPSVFAAAPDTRPRDPPFIAWSAALVSAVAGKMGLVFGTLLRPIAARAGHDGDPVLATLYAPIEAYVEKSKALNVSLIYLVTDGVPFIPEGYRCAAHSLYEPPTGIHRFPPVFSYPANFSATASGQRHHWPNIISVLQSHGDLFRAATIAVPTARYVDAPPGTAVASPPTSQSFSPVPSPLSSSPPSPSSPSPPPSSIAPESLVGALAVMAPHPLRPPSSTAPAATSVSLSSRAPSPAPSAASSSSTAAQQLQKQQPQQQQGAAAVARYVGAALAGLFRSPALPAPAQLVPPPARRASVTSSRRLSAVHTGSAFFSSSSALSSAYEVGTTGASLTAVAFHDPHPSFDCTYVLARVDPRLVAVVLLPGRPEASATSSGAASPALAAATAKGASAGPVPVPADAAELFRWLTAVAALRPVAAALAVRR
ncbi:hypothetical protein HK405_014530 [Cladochytrium tenue]|nr:hypothetical protein HK405_014530 [Cladochytrium tenue]